MDEDRLAGRLALQELKASYFRYLDTKQWPAGRELFTDHMGRPGQDRSRY